MDTSSAHDVLTTDEEEPVEGFLVSDASTPTNHLSTGK
jgi:hypothetical protein